MQIFGKVLFDIVGLFFWALLWWIVRDYIKLIKKLEERVNYLLSQLHTIHNYDELKSILKEAGIIIEPPKNIEVPDPRGYSVKKVK